MSQSVESGGLENLTEADNELVQGSEDSNDASMTILDDQLSVMDSLVVPSDSLVVADASDEGVEEDGILIPVLQDSGGTLSIVGEDGIPTPMAVVHETSDGPQLHAVGSSPQQEDKEELVDVADEDEMECSKDSLPSENKDALNVATLATVTLPDGTQAFLTQQMKGQHSLLLEDGTQTYVALMPDDDDFDPTTVLQVVSSTPSSPPPPSSPASTSTSSVVAPDKDETATSSVDTGEDISTHPEKSFKCGLAGCGKLYTTIHHLRVHQRSHTGDRPFACMFQSCNKAFATSYGLKSHIRTHTGEKPYKCPEEMCLKSFKTSGDLQKHIRTHTGERPFKCFFEGCDRAFTTSNIRKVHMRTHTGERPYACPYSHCPRRFASATNYKNHLRIHTGEKPYVCTYQNCGKRFTEYSSLYKHHIVHTVQKPFYCSDCCRHYRQQTSLTVHKRAVHGIVEGEDGMDVPVGGALSYVNSGEKLKEKKSKPEDGTLIELEDPLADEAALAALQAAQQAAEQAVQQVQAIQTSGIQSEQHVFVIADENQLLALEQLGLTTASLLGETSDITLTAAATGESTDTTQEDFVEGVTA